MGTKITNSTKSDQPLETSLVAPDGSYEVVPLRKDDITIMAVQSRVVPVRADKAKEMKKANLDHMLDLIDAAATWMGPKDIIHFHEFPITGFFYMEEGRLDDQIQKKKKKRALKAYEKVLESKPQKCPISLFVDEILGPRTVEEYHLFKKEGFDVPISGQKAFFTMMIPPISFHLYANGFSLP